MVSVMQTENRKMIKMVASATYRFPTRPYCCGQFGRQPGYSEKVAEDHGADDDNKTHAADLHRVVAAQKAFPGEAAFWQRQNQRTETSYPPPQ
jgi:hypothetical protein